jgi:hypothetical protein
MRWRGQAPAKSGDFGRRCSEAWQLRRAALVPVLLLTLLGSSVPAAFARPPVAIATFDSLPEGTAGTVLTDGGITFLGLDQRIPDSPGEGVFVIEQADASHLGGPDGFTPPNVLSFGGVAPGPDVGFGRVGEFRISAPKRGKSASLELWYFGSVPGNVVTLEAIRRGVVVATDAVTLLGGNVVHHYTLAVSGKPFSELRVVGSGETDNGVFFGLFDSVRIGRVRLTS